MGQVHSRCSSGKQLLGACSSGNMEHGRFLLQDSPAASCYVTCMERNSPLLVAAGRGHTRMVQAILEAAVVSQGLSKAKKRCINHSNSKGQSALMVACISGHAQCVEVLVCNGASPLLLDNARHNSALHWAASCCRADCVGRLLGSGASFQMQSGQLVAIADIPCFDEDNSTLVKFVDRHNGWGVTALHLAVYKGSSSTVRALLRHGASVSARTTPPSLSISPVLQPPGSTALHFAAAAEDVSVVLVLLEAQVARNESDLRRATNIQGDRPLDLARSSSNPLLLQLLDPSHSLALHPGPRSGIVLNPGGSISRVITREGLRQHQALLGLATGTGFRASRRGLEQLPHVALGALLHRLKLVMTLEAFALQQQLGGIAGSSDGSEAAATPAVHSLLAKQQQAKEQSVLAAGDCEDAGAVNDAIGTQIGTGTSVDGTLSRVNSTAALAAAAPGSTAAAALPAEPAAGGSHVQPRDAAFNSSSSSGSSATAPEISPAIGCGAPAEDDTQVVADVHQQQHNSQHLQQQQQQQPSTTAEAAAQRMRLRTLQQLIGMVNEMLAVLPPSATAAAGASPQNSPHGTAAATPFQEQQHHQQQGVVGMGARTGSGNSSVGDGVAAGGGGGSSSAGGWRLLGGLLPRHAARHDEDSNAHLANNHQQQQRLLSLLPGAQHDHGTIGSSQQAVGAAAGAVTISEEVLPAYITPSLLSSLAAVTKLFVAASSLSGQQHTPGLGLLGVWVSSAGGADNNSSVRWAEQEHALMLLKGVLQTARSALEAAQQASAAAASRSALRERQQQQLATMLGAERLVVHSSSLRRVLLGDRLGEQVRIRFGGSSSSASASSRQHEHPISAAAAFTGGMGLSWGLETVMVGTSGGNSPMRHSSRRHHRDRSRRSRGDESGADITQDRGSRRHHHRHHSRHHRSSRRNRTPRGLDLHQHDLGIMPSSADAAALSAVAISLSPRSSLMPVGGLHPAAPSSSGSDSHQLPLPFAAPSAATAGAGAAVGLTAEQQQQQQCLQELADILREHVGNTTGPWGEQGGPSAAAAAVDASPGSRDQSNRAAGAAAAAAAGSSSASAASVGGGGSSSSGHLSDGGQVGAASRADGMTSLHDDSDDMGEEEEEEQEDAAADALSCSSLDGDTCAICMDCTAGLSVSRCSHRVCLQCAYQLCYKAKGVPLCPFCRQPIDGFEASTPVAPAAAAAVGGGGDSTGGTSSC